MRPTIRRLARLAISRRFRRRNVIDWNTLIKMAWLVYGAVFGLGLALGFLAGRRARRP